MKKCQINVNNRTNYEKYQQKYNLLYKITKFAQKNILLYNVQFS